MDFFPGEPGTKEIQQIRYQGRPPSVAKCWTHPEPAKSISLSKCPVFPTSVMSFNFPHVVKVMIPVGETKMSISDMTVSTWTAS